MLFLRLPLRRMEDKVTTSVNAAVVRRGIT
jgi:hypothetical protein